MPKPARGSQEPPKGKDQIEVNEIKAQVAPTGPIHVVALRQGFFNNCRISVGDKFTLDNEKQFADWMQKI